MTSIKITQEYTNHQQNLYSNIYNWKDKASCADSLSKNEDFFNSTESQMKLLAMKYCFRCPVQKHCLYTALVTQEIYGLWGALTPKQRKTYFKYISLKASEANINTRIWSKELDEYFIQYSDFQKVAEVLSIKQ